MSQKSTKAQYLINISDMSRTHQVSSSPLTREGKDREFLFRNVEPLDHNKAKQPDSNKRAPVEQGAARLSFRELWQVYESGYTEVRMFGGVWHPKGREARPTSIANPPSPWGSKDSSVCWCPSGKGTHFSLISPLLFSAFFGVAATVKPRDRPLPPHSSLSPRYLGQWLGQQPGNQTEPR
jgi:hypothetical protein